MAESRKVVLSDIARLARVHVSTVSLALRNSPKVAPHTRTRILEIAEKLEYRPDPQLLSLVSYRKRLKSPDCTASIAIISDSHFSKTLECNSYYRTVERGIEAEARTHGFNPAFLTLDKDFHSDAQLDRILQSRGIQGILIHSVYHPETRFELDWDQYACVKINRFPKHLPVDSVMSNGALGVKLAFRAAIKAGYRRPALAVCRDDEDHIGHQLQSAFLLQQQQLDPAERIPPFVFPYSNGQSFVQRFFPWFEACKPDLLISNWGLSVVCFQYQQQYGRSIGFLPLELSREDSPVPGLLPDNEEIGRKAVRLLAQKLNQFEYGFPKRTSQVLVDPIWYDPNPSTGQSIARLNDFRVYSLDRGDDPDYFIRTYKTG